MRPYSLLKYFIFLLLHSMIILIFSCSHKTLEKDIDLVYDFYDQNKSQSFNKFFNWEINPRDENSPLNKIFIAKYIYYHKYNRNKTFTNDFYFSFSFETKNNGEIKIDYGNNSDSLLTIFSSIQNIPTKDIRDTIYSLVQDFISLDIESLGAYFAEDSLILFKLKPNIFMLFSTEKLSLEELGKYHEFSKIDENWYYKMNPSK